MSIKVAGISIEQDFCIPAEGKSSLPMIQKIQVLNEFLKKEPIFSEVNIYNRNSFHLFYALDENQIGKNLKEFELLLESEKFSNFRVRTRRRPMFIPLCPNGFRPVIFENASFRVIKDDQIPYFIHSLMNWGY